MVEVDLLISVMGIRTTSSIGYGNDQCKSRTQAAVFWPSPTGLPKRRMTAFSCGPTVKKPEPKNASTISTITILTMQSCCATPRPAPANRRPAFPARCVVVGMFVCRRSCYWLTELVGRCWNKSNGGVRSSKIRVDLLVERLFQRVNAATGTRPVPGFCWNTRQRLGGLGLALALDARGGGLRVGDGFGGLPVGGGLDLGRLGFAFDIAPRLMSFCRSDFMRSNTVCVTLSGRPIFLMPRNSMLMP